MTGVGLKKLARTPVPKLPSTYPPECMSRSQTDGWIGGINPGMSCGIMSLRMSCGCQTDEGRGGGARLSQQQLR